MSEDDDMQCYVLLFNATHKGGEYRKPLTQATIVQSRNAAVRLAAELWHLGMATWAIVPCRAFTSQYGLCVGIGEIG